MSESVQICLLVAVPKIDAGLASAALFLYPYRDKPDLAMLQDKVKIVSPTPKPVYATAHQAAAA